jgi:predicted DNA-binding ribbon-helix-helix protein
MSAQERSKAGRFAPKSTELREVRTIRLTNTTWEKLGAAADSRCITRADLIEQLVKSGALDAQPPASGIDFHHIEQAVTQILDDSTVTRNGKDRGSVRRALDALLKILR